MTKWILRVFLAAILAGIGLWLFNVFFPSPEKVIRKRLQALAEAASFKGNDAPLVKLSRTQELGTFVLPDVSISIEIPGRNVFTINGRDDLLELAGGARFATQGLDVQFVDINITVGPGKETATAELTVKARVAGERDLIVTELRFDFRKADGDWLIQRVETLKTLKLTH